MKYLPPTPERSALMARIKSKDTKPELTVRRMVHALGYRYVVSVQSSHLDWAARAAHLDCSCAPT